MLAKFIYLELNNIAIRVTAIGRPEPLILLASRGGTVKKHTGILQSFIFVVK